jgi:hypothetical protein
MRSVSLLSIIVCIILGLTGPPPARGQDTPWTELFAKDLSAFKAPQDGWTPAGAVGLDPQNPRTLAGSTGHGAWYNGPKGRARNLFTKEKYGDLEISLEFMMAKGSNSGIKFHGHYEIQIADSFGRKEARGEDCGGIYPRAEAKPRYHHIDKGIAPRINACKPPGEWQTLQAVFLAPRFDNDGKKTANAIIRSARLNGQVIHENQELQWPTGDRWKGPEFREGVLMIQADHGPVAFRNVKVRVPQTK